MNLILTGSLGHISKPLAQELIQKGHAVTIISSKPDKQPAIEALGAHAAIGSLEDAAFLTATFTGADAVYTMIPPSPLGFNDPHLDIAGYIGTVTRAYVDAIQRAGVPRVVHLSSVGADLAQGTGVLRTIHHEPEVALGQLPNVAITFMRPTTFYYNLLNNIKTIKGDGVLGRFLALRYYGLLPMLKGETGIMLSSYGADDKIVWVSPLDIAAAIAEELTTPLVGRKVRYVASEELTCNEVARILGQAIGKPYLKWVVISDKQLQSGMERFGIPKPLAQELVTLNASMHSGLVFEDYYRHRPPLGKVKLQDWAPEFAAAYAKS